MRCDPQEEAILSQVREAIAARLTPAGPFTREEWIVCGQLGLLGMCVPESYGGRGLGARMLARLLRTLGQVCADLGLGFSVGAHAFGCVRPIFEYGSEDLRAGALPALVSGEAVGALAMTECDAGSDIAAIQTRAVRRGDQYVLNGEKIYVTNAPLASLFLVFAITEPRHGILGISGFVVDRDSPGLEIGDPIRKTALESSPMASVRLSDTPVRLENRLGAEGQGREIFALAMEWERTCLSGLFVGMLDRQLDEVVEQARTRRQFGRAIADHQAIAHRIAGMYVRLKLAELLVEQAGCMLDEGDPGGIESCVAKLAAADAAIQSSLDAIQIFGAAGILIDRGIERYLRDAVAGPLFAGTSEMLRDRIAAHLLR